ncbi:MAG TPA: vitamin K epoxide reductase family protein, partial [Bacteroidales bacterium]|nr:vitamin K epoxide reductase family protein [Bacteroidales bacterium]
LMIYKFKQDVVGNGVAVVILTMMIASLIAALVIPLSSVKVPKVLTIFPNWTIPFLVVIGLATAVYLSYVEVSEMRAFCGPVGNCNAVQNSPYAKLFGILPIPIMGIVGYAIILAVWLLQQFGPPSLNKVAPVGLWGLGIGSVLFSSYLTFLEPFVIGATCAFCLASAIVATMILWASILSACKAIKRPHQECQ